MVEYLFLIVIVILGILTSYTDTKFGKIKNREILWAFFLAILIYVGGFYGNYFSSATILKTIKLVLFCGLLSFIIWKFRFWSAGDAKLFSVFFLLIPLAFYTDGESPLLSFFVNSTIPLFLILLMAMIFTTTMKQKKAALFGLFKDYRFVRLVIIIFGITWLSGYVFRLIGITPNYIANILFIIILYGLIERMPIKNIKGYKIDAIKIFALAAIIRLFVDHNIRSLLFLKQFIILTLTYALFRMVVYNLSKTFVKKVSIEELRVGDIISDAIVLRKGKYVKKRFHQYSYRNILIKTGEFLFEPTSDGLTKADVAKIRELQKQGKLEFRTVAIYQTIPFAPFLFLGALLTILCKGSCITALLNLL